MEGPLETLYFTAPIATMTHLSRTEVPLNPLNPSSEGGKKGAVGKATDVSLLAATTSSA